MPIFIALFKIDESSVSFGRKAFTFSHDRRKLTSSEVADVRTTRGKGSAFELDSGQISGIGIIGLVKPRVVLILRNLVRYKS